MLTVLFLWSLVFFIFYTIGFSVVKMIRAVSVSLSEEDPSADEVFFTGFLTLSVFTGILSIFISLGYTVLICFAIITLILFLINRKEITRSLKELFKVLYELSRWEIVFVLFLSIFLLTAVAQKITLGDTGLYHVQSIQWVRKYAVIPGLGNIHSRLAYNSMFLVISGLFTFQIKNILIFPLNGICYLVLSLKLFFLYRAENKPGTRWKAVFYILLLLISLLILLPDLNTPAADIICGTLIIYAFILIMKLEKKGNQLTITQIVLFNAVIFSCVAFKISSLFLCASLLFLYDKKILQRMSLTAFVGILILSSFLIRNYYLSGYLIYPFPSVDIFNVDWKIPFGNALSEKFEIESWAKIPAVPPSEVIHMKISEWFLPWMRSMNFLKKLLIAGNLLSIFSIVFMVLRKDYFFLKIQLIVLLNLAFWFLSAPDPRFSMGSLFIGFSLNVAYITSLFETESSYRIVRIFLAGFLIMIFCRRITFPLNTLSHPARWVIPPAMETTLTNEYFTGFHYRVPVEGDQCFNVEIPCVPYELNDVELRGKDISDGFKIKKKI